MNASISDGIDAPLREVGGGDPAVEPTGTAGFTWDRKYFWLGLFGCGFFLAMEWGTVLAFYSHSAGSTARAEQPPKMMGVIIPAGWFMWLVVSVGQTWCAVKCRLSLSADGVRQQGGFRQTSMRWDEVSELRWKGRGSNVVLRSPERRIRIEFYVYSLADRHEIVAQIRRRIPDHAKKSGRPHTEELFPVAEKIIRPGHLFAGIVGCILIGLVAAAVCSVANSRSIRFFSIAVGPMAAAHGSVLAFWFAPRSRQRRFWVAAWLSLLPVAAWVWLFYASLQ